MSSTVSDDQIRQAVLGSVELGSYPESQDVAAAEVPSHLLPVLQSELNNARDNVEVCGRCLCGQEALILIRVHAGPSPSTQQELRWRH